MPSGVASAIDAHPMLGKCPPIERARLMGHVEPCAFEAGGAIIQAGAPASHYYWILQGDAELLLPGSRPLGPGDDLGSEALADGLAQSPCYLAGARALTPLRALRIPRLALLELAARHPPLKTGLLLGMARRMAGGEDPAPAAAPPQAARPLPAKQRVGWIATLLLSPLAWLAAQQAGLPPHGAVYAGLFTMTVLMWLFALVDEYIPPIIAVVAMLFIDLVPAQVALHGFYSRTFLLLLGVYALSALMVSSGLAYRFMLRLLTWLPDTPFWHRSALTASGFLLSIVMPSSNARLALMLPLYREMDNSLGAPAQSRPATALMVATFTGATLFSPLLLTAKSSNLAAFTMLPIQVRQEFQGFWWLGAAAVVAIGLLGAHLLAMRFLFRAHEARPLPLERIRTQLAILGPLRVPEWIAGGAFLLFLAGAALPQWHQSQAAWLAGFILAGLLVMGMFDKRAFQSQIDWPLIFFLLCLDGFTEAISYLGLDSAMVQAIGSRLDWIQGQLGWFIVLAALVTVVIRLALPVTAGMILSATLLLPIGMDQGIHPWIALFLTSLFSDIWFMPHQNSSFQQALAGGLRARCDEALFFRYAWWLNPLRIALAYASIPYWQWLGLY